MSTAPHDHVRGRWLSGHSTLPPSPDPIGSRGIAAIELAAALAVTSLMIAVTVSAYRTYAVRQEVRRHLLAIHPVQALVIYEFERSGVSPVSEHDLPGLPVTIPHDRAIHAVTIDHGRIEITFGQDAAAGLRGRALRVTPFETSEGQIVWLCGDGPPGVGLYPLGFIGGTNLSAEPLKTVKPRYLPPECR
jgi:hypothetical protein